MADNISKNQVELLQQLCIYRQEHGASPSFRELAKLAKVSDVKSVYRMTENLEKAGLLEKEKRKSRSLKLSDKGMEAIGLYSFPVKFEAAPSIHSQESLHYRDKLLETSGTYSKDDLQEIIKSEIAAMGAHPTGTTLQEHNPKEIVMRSFSSAIYQLSNTEGYIAKLGSAILLLLLFMGECRNNRN